MKLCKNIHVYGLERIVFDEKTVYELRNKSECFAGEWERTVSQRNEKTEVGLIPHQHMAKNITSICRTKEYEVGINGNTLHVNTVYPMTVLSTCDCDNECARESPNIIFMCARHGE
jgi:hypothetical protein